MSDIASFLNSKDIADYWRSIGFICTSTRHGCKVEILSRECEQMLWCEIMIVKRYILVIIDFFLKKCYNDSNIIATRLNYEIQRQS